MNIDKKRRAVFTTLSSVVQGDDLWKAMWAWQDGYADRSQFELNAFFNECRHIRAIAEQRPVLYRQLIGLLMGDGDTLKPDPLAQMQQYRERHGVSQDKAHIEVLDPVDDKLEEGFLLVISQLHRQVDESAWRHVIIYAEREAQFQNMPPDLVYAFTQWASGGRHSEAIQAPLDMLRNMLNLVYVGMCEQLGPVVADRYLAQAMKIAVAAELAADPRLLLVHR
ncbi:hypothetical protein [Parathalassolituus penaei]|uniref:Uncharacterized protein n=1 Tax=Parathalassolituus penaei TaxID=2997323 RepID=A0A9X3IQI5_9GAMM|nr:hypothetical protein [Parathalassolituus penaei]MCY0963831.1 hypothetical protein [Parathalassolituus penaei]